MSAKMKVRIKGKEQTAVEKRNTGIATFALVAVIPLLLSLLIGYELGDTDTVNKENLLVEIDSQQKEIASLTKEVEGAKKNLFIVNEIFSDADSVFKKLNTHDLKNLEQKLRDAESERDFDRWDNDNDQIEDDFQHDLERIIKPLDFDESTPIPFILQYGKRWLEKYAEAKAAELNLMKIKPNARCRCRC